MSKCSGIIGYSMAVETQPGIWSDEITEKKYYGSIIKDNRKMDNTGVINSGISINNNISIISNNSCKLFLNECQSILV